MKRFFKKASLAGLLAVVLSAVGCYNYGGGIAPSTIPITSKDAYTEVGQVTGRSMTPTIFGLGILPTSGNAAIQKAKKNNNCDGIIDVAVENKTYSLMVVGLNFIEVNGTGIKFQRGAAK